MTGGISAGTRNDLSQPLFPRTVFETWADASWGVDKETGEHEPDALIFTRQMAALYKPESWPGQNLVLEMAYTDVNARYQIILEKAGSRILTGSFLSATTTIKTPITIWKAIAAGEINGSEALMRRQYQVDGDFDLLLNWNKYFVGLRNVEANEKKDAVSVSGVHAPAKATNMNILLIPWIAFWAGVSFHSFWGGLGSLAVCVLVTLVFYRNYKTFYDILSVDLVTCFSTAALLGAPVRLIVPLAYMAFGLMWTASCFSRIPLTAHYSMNDYGGESALSNPIFIKTNRILTLAWGVLYLLTPIWTYFILGTSIGGGIGAINSILPLLMGVFTKWFQKWYPAKFIKAI